MELVYVNRVFTMLFKNHGPDVLHDMCQSINLHLLVGVTGSSYCAWLDPTLK